ncbi:hypothetical protein ATCC90586_001075 [Pythium insidiosum]|nr:hypothetical protein ATCC90586_001075 [Pythium insidiosum]
MRRHAARPRPAGKKPRIPLTKRSWATETPLTLSAQPSNQAPPASEAEASAPVRADAKRASSNHDDSHDWKAEAAAAAAAAQHSDVEKEEEDQQQQQQQDEEDDDEDDGSPREESTRGVWKRLWRGMLKIFEPLDFKNAKPRRPQQTYVVRAGDTLAAIASEHGMKEVEVRAINDLWVGNVSAGQEIRVHRKRRSQSLPQLPFAEEYADAQEASHPEYSDPAHEELDESSPQKLQAARSLGVIFENHPQKEDELRPELLGKPTKHAPRLKTRSLSERMPTHKEQESSLYGLPTLLGGTADEILSASSPIVPKLEAYLPMRCRGYDWQLLYSSSQHGSSLHTLLRKVRGYSSSLVVVETCDGEVFGGFATECWSNSPSYYGNGECFVFTTVPRFEVFNWQRGNTMFMLTNDSSIAMGGGGSFAWLLNADLFSGCSGFSDTFKNRCLTSTEHFDIAAVEVWGFVMKA